MSNDTKDFLQRQSALNDKLATLTDDYAALMGDIKADGTHFTGFRKVKETFFRLQALTLRNGRTTEKKERGSSNHAIFQKDPNMDIRGEVRTPLAEQKSAPDLFNRARNLEAASSEEQPAKATNDAAPDLFEKKAAPVPHAPIRKATKPAEPDAKRKVLATSEDRTKKGDD